MTDSPPHPALAVTVSAAPTMIAEGDTSTITAMANRPVEAADGTVTVHVVVAPRRSHAQRAFAHHRGGRTVRNPLR